MRRSRVRIPEGFHEDPGHERYNPLPGLGLALIETSKAAKRQAGASASSSGADPMV